MSTDKISNGGPMAYEWAGGDETYIRVEFEDDAGKRDRERLQALRDGLREAADDLDALLAERLKDPTFVDAYIQAGLITGARAEGYRLGRAEAIADLRARADGSDGLLIGYMSAAAYLEAKGHQP